MHSAILGAVRHTSRVRTAKAVEIGNIPSFLAKLNNVSNLRQGHPY